MYLDPEGWRLASQVDARGVRRIGWMSTSERGWPSRQASRVNRPHLQRIKLVTNQSKLVSLGVVHGWHIHWRPLLWCAEQSEEGCEDGGRSRI